LVYDSIEDELGKKILEAELANFKKTAFGKWKYIEK